MTMSEAKKLFRAYMVPTENGVLVIDRHDFNHIIDMVYRDFYKEKQDG